MGAGDAQALLQLGPATVLASPGAPGALDAFLPGGKRPGTLVWPLPKGPVVVLGLPRQDETAQQIADAFQIDTEDLEGGYRIAAWRTKTRPIVLIMAADEAALHAARFEFDVDAPMEMMAPGMRSLDFKRPNQEAGFAVRPGTRLITPHYRLRGFDVRARGQAVGGDLVSTAAGARANRLWLSLEDLAAPGVAKTITLARRHGVAVVACADVQLARAAEPAYRRGVLTSLVAAQEALGLRHFAVAFRPRGPGLTRPDNPQRESDLAYHLAEALRPGGLRELTIIPAGHSDRLATSCGGAPALGRIPEAVIAWSGPSRYATTITRAQAERRVKEAGIPVVLLDHWAAPFQDSSLPYVPSLPQGRADDLHDVLDGVIVIGRHGTEAILESLWAPLEEPRFGMNLLNSLCPVEEEGGLVWLTAHSHRLAAADKENLGLVPWLEPLRRELDAVRPLVVLGHALELGTLSGATLRTDGHVDGEPAWTALAGSPLVKTREGLTVRILASPRALHLAVVAPPAALAERELLLRISVRRPGTRRGLVAELTPKGWHLSGALAGGAPAAEAAHGAVRGADGALTAELELSRFALGGEPHCGRAFEASIRWGPQQLWPKDAAQGAIYVGMARGKFAAPAPKK